MTEFEKEMLKVLWEISAALDKQAVASENAAAELMQLRHVR